MPINRWRGLRQRRKKSLNDAYEGALSALSLVDRNDPLTEIVAKRVIEISRTIIDPADISHLAVESLKLYPYKRSYIVALRPNKISATDPASTWWHGER